MKQVHSRPEKAEASSQSVVPRPLLRSTHDVRIPSVPKNAARAYAEWHDADTKAREAESRLKAAWLAYDRKDEAPPHSRAASHRRVRMWSRNGDCR